MKRRLETSINGGCKQDPPQLPKRKRGLRELALTLAILCASSMAPVSAATQTRYLLEEPGNWSCSIDFKQEQTDSDDLSFRPIFMCQTPCTVNDHCEPEVDLAAHAAVDKLGPDERYLFDHSNQVKLHLTHFVTDSSTVSLCQLLESASPARKPYVNFDRVDFIEIQIRSSNIEDLVQIPAVAAARLNGCELGSGQTCKCGNLFKLKRILLGGGRLSGTFEELLGNGRGRSVSSIRLIDTDPQLFDPRLSHAVTHDMPLLEEVVMKINPPKVLEDYIVDMHELFQNNQPALRRIHLSSSNNLEVLSPLRVTVPEHLSGLKRLEALELENIDLRNASGVAVIPVALGELQNLKSLELMELLHLGKAALPGWIGSLLKNLRVLRVTTSNLEGSVPASLGDAVNLEVLDFSSNNEFTNNQLTGEFPASVSLLPNLNSINLDANKLNGTYYVNPNIRNIRTLRLSNNGFSSLYVGSPPNSTLLTRGPYHNSGNASRSHNTSTLDGPALIDDSQSKGITFGANWVCSCDFFNNIMGIVRSAGSPLIESPGTTCNVPESSAVLDTLRYAGGPCRKTGGSYARIESALVASWSEVQVNWTRPESLTFFDEKTKPPSDFVTPRGGVPVSAALGTDHPQQSADDETREMIEEKYGSSCNACSDLRHDLQHSNLALKNPRETNFVVFLVKFAPTLHSAPSCCQVVLQEEGKTSYSHSLQALDLLQSDGHVSVTAATVGLSAEWTAAASTRVESGMHVRLQESAISGATVPTSIILPSSSAPPLTLLPDFDASFVAISSQAMFKLEMKDGQFVLISGDRTSANSGSGDRLQTPEKKEKELTLLITRLQDGEVIYSDAFIFGQPQKVSGIIAAVESGRESGQSYEIIVRQKAGDEYQGVGNILYTSDLFSTPVPDLNTCQPGFGAGSTDTDDGGMVMTTQTADRCEPCGIGTYSTGDMAVCRECPVGRTTEFTETTNAFGCNVAAPDYFSDRGSFYPCAPNMNCSKVGSTRQTLELMDGYWRPNPDSLDIYRCRPFSGCHSRNVADDGTNSTVAVRRALAGDNDQQPTCAPNFVGALCTRCKEGYAFKGRNKDLDGELQECIECTGDIIANVKAKIAVLCGFLVLFLFSPYIIALLYVCYVRKSQRVAFEKRSNEEIGDPQEAGQRATPAGIKKRWPSALRSTLNVLKRCFAAKTLSLVEFAQSYLLFAYYFDVKGMPRPYRSLAGAIFPHHSECLFVSTEMYYRTCWGLTLALLLLVGNIHIAKYFAVRVLKKRSPRQAEAASRTAWFMSHVWLWVFLPAIVALFAGSFECMDIGGTEYLVAGVETECRGGTLKVAWLTCTVAISIGIVVVTLSVFILPVVRNRQLLRMRSWANLDRAQLDKVRELVFLHFPYTSSRYWFSLYHLVENLILVLGVVALKPTIRALPKVWRFQETDYYKNSPTLELGAIPQVITAFFLTLASVFMLQIIQPYRNRFDAAYATLTKAMLCAICLTIFVVTFHVANDFDFVREQNINYSAVIMGILVVQVLAGIGLGCYDAVHLSQYPDREDELRVKLERNFYHRAAAADENVALISQTDADQRQLDSIYISDGMQSWSSNTDTESGKGSEELSAVSPTASSAAGMSALADKAPLAGPVIPPLSPLRMLIKPEDSNSYLNCSFDGLASSFSLSHADSQSASLTSMSYAQDQSGSGPMISNFLGHRIEGALIQHLEGGVVSVCGVHFAPDGSLRCDGLPHQDERVIIGKHDVILVEPLGQGAGGMVYLGLDVRSFRLIAVKRVPIHDARRAAQAAHEVKALEMCAEDSGRASESKHIVGFHGAYFDDEEEMLCIVLDFVSGGSLDDVIQAAGTFPEHNAASSSTPSPKAGYRFPTVFESQTHSTKVECAARPPAPGIEAPEVAMHDEKLFACLAKDMLLALDCLYDLNMVHLDIKPSNILVGAQGHACLSDFGLARNVEEYRNGSRSKFVGTMKYLSPDRLRGAPGSFGSDVWALGLSLLEVILGRYPVKIEAGSDLDTESAAYDGMQPNEQKDMYWVLLEHLDGDALALPEYVRVPGGQIVRVSDQLRDFLSKMLGPNDDERPTARELLSHEWITSQADSHTDYTDNYDRLFSNADFAEKSRVLGVLSSELFQKYASSTYRDCARSENIGSGKESKGDLDELLGNGHNFDKMVACHTDQGNPPVEAYHVPVTHVRGLAKLLVLQEDIVRFAFVNNALPTRVCFCIA